LNAFVSGQGLDALTVVGLTTQRFKKRTDRTSAIDPRFALNTRKLYWGSYFTVFCYPK